MNKITELTKEQELLIPKYREEFLNIGLSTELGNKDIAKENIFKMYEVLGQKRPEYFFWFDSPIAAILAANFLSIDFKGDQLWDQLGGQLRDQLRGQLWDQLGDQ